MNDTNDYISLDEVLRRRTLYNLHIYSKTSEGHVYLAFHANDRQEYLVDRVMPGETLRDAITRKLKAELHITDWKLAHTIGLADLTKDNRGRETLKVDAYVMVPYFELSADKRVDGLQLQWISAE